MGGNYDNFKIVINYAEAGYDSWTASYGLTSGVYGDDDDDGKSNIYEYGFGGDPTNPGDIGAVPTIVYGAGGTVTHSHVVLADANDVAYLVEQTTDLVLGTWTNSGWSGISTNVSGGEFDEVEHSVLGGDKDKLFIRVQVTQP